MEFPDDILAIVRAYSKPRMQFSGKYNKYSEELRINRQVFYLRPIVQKRLCDKDADKVIEAFAEYVVALLATKNETTLLQIAPFGNDTLTWQERHDIGTRVTSLAEVQYNKTSTLLDLLYWQEKDESMVRQYEHEKRFARFRHFEIISNL